MKKSITKSQLRAALCHLTGWLTENSTKRDVKGMKEICSSAFPAKEDAEACMQVFRAMLTKGWARLNGCNARAIYTSSCTTPKNDSDEAITAAMEELMPFIGAEKVKNESVDARVREEPEKELGKCIKQDEKSPEKCEKEDTKADGKCEEPFSIPWDAIKNLAKSSPEILVEMLRNEGWNVTAKKTITIEKEL